MNGCGIHSLPGCCSSLTSLRCLQFAHNHLTLLDSSIVGCLSNLTSLSLDGNLITEIPDSAKQWQGIISIFVSLKIVLNIRFCLTFLLLLLLLVEFKSIDENIVDCCSILALFANNSVERQSRAGKSTRHHTVRLE
jgi:Leucine-rich repeat (LRR) protein